MRTLRGLFGLLSILFSIFLFIILWFFYALLINDIFGGGGILAGGGFALLPLLSIAPAGLIAGITAMAKRTKKIGTIVAGIFFIATGALGVNGNPAYSATSSFFTYVGYAYIVVGLLFILSAILQRGMTLGPKMETRMSSPSSSVQTFGPSHLPVQTYEQYQQPIQAPLPVVVPPVESNVGGWVCSCDQINEKDTKFCTRCGKTNPAMETWPCACGTNNAKDAKFCASCGQSNLALETWPCACGTNNVKDAKFCASCGQPNPALETWPCACGTNNVKDAKFCASCGQPNPALETWACACGVTNEKDAKFCKSCGLPKL